MTAMDDPVFQKVSISGPVLASLIQRISTSVADVDGLLFGHITNSVVSSISDDEPTASTTTLISTVSSFITTAIKPSFYTSTGQIDPLSLRRLLPPSSSLTLIGWFSSRRNTLPRPSLRDFSVSLSLSSKSQLRLSIQNSSSSSSSSFSSSISPCLFLLFTTPPPPPHNSFQFIHTHEYRAYQFRTDSLTFDPKSIDIVNIEPDPKSIGPAFRGHYNNFIPNSPFPMMTCEMRGNPMAVDFSDLTKEDPRELSSCSQEFQLRGLSRLVGPDASTYTAGLEDLYDNMLSKLEALARLVEDSSAKVLEQENKNIKLRYKVAGLE